MCRKNWDVHGYTSTCNTFQEKQISESLNAQAEALAKLEKWLFYYDRFTNHELSTNLDRHLYEQAEEKMVEVQNTSGLSWIEARFDICFLIPTFFRHRCRVDPQLFIFARFMKDAVDELTKCRATLKVLQPFYQLTQ